MIRKYLFLLVVWGSALSMPGCFSRFRKAEELVAQKKYIEAVRILEELSAEDPRNADLRRTLERTRFLAVEDVLRKAREKRFASDFRASQEFFAQGLALRQKWNVKLNGALESTVNDEREDATMRLRSLVFPKTKAGHALAAEGAFVDHLFLLQHSEMTALRNELATAIQQSGADTCKRLFKSISAQQPHWTGLVGRYCRHFQQPAPAEPVLAETFSNAAVSVSVSSAGEGISGDLSAWLNSEFRRSPWYAERGPGTAELTGRGTATIRNRQDWVPMTASWLEQVPFQVDVVKVLQESVPVTECEINETMDSNGRRQVVGREVTRNKVRQRQVVVQETRFRNVPRVFNYQALRLDRSLEFTARVDFRKADDLIASAGLSDSETSYGYQHDVSFAPANVSPSRVNFTPAENWFYGLARKVAVDFGSSLDDGWRSRYCRTSSYSLEEAARCVRVGEGVPRESLKSLESTLGEDAFWVLPLYRLQ